MSSLMCRSSKRFGMLIKQMSKGLGYKLPLACRDWANTKAAYRLINNDRVSEAEILTGHSGAL